jgi:hypothetical protein
LQAVRNRMLEQRLRLVERISRPLITTTDKRLYENPSLLRRGPHGFRLVLVDRPGAFEYPPEQGAMAAASTSASQDAEQVRAIQMASGESNLSLMANVDPSQARTATGARLMQQNMDVLVKSDLTTVTDSGVKQSVEIMFLLNASEMRDAVNFDPQKYDERWAMQSEEKWLRAYPYHFQGDGALTVESGSTLADDDEANVVKSQTLWGLAMQRPDIINVQTAAERVLEAMGERQRLQKWMVPPSPPQEEPPKRSVSMAMKLEDIPPELRLQFMVENGFLKPPPAPAPDQQQQQAQEPMMPPPGMDEQGGEFPMPEMPDFSLQ